MSNTKQKIISELKSKLTQFKSQLKSHKSKDEQDEKKENEEIILKLPSNKNNIEKNNNKENIDNNTIINKQIKPSKIERANSTCFSFGSTKKFLDFDFDKMLNENKRHSNSKSNINIDELNIMTKNKTFINLDLNTKKIFSKTDRQKDMFNLNNINNLNHINDDYINNRNKYEQNYSEPNVDNYKTIRNHNNNIRLQNKIFNFSINDLIPLPKTKNEKERFSAKPEIRTDVSRYNLNFMTNNNYNLNNNNKNTNRKSSAKLFTNSNIYKKDNNNNYSMNIKNILNNNTRNTNINSFNGLNNKYLISSHTTYNYNSYNRFNGYNDYNKINKRKNFLTEFENNKSNNQNLNMKDIHKVKYMIQNLSTDEINNMPISVFKEMKDLYDLIYRKFLKNNLI